MAHARSVLIALAHEDSRQLYAEYLQHMGFDVLPAADGDTARQLAPLADVVVTGLIFPTLDGAALITAIRSSECTRNTPVIVVAAAVFPSDRARAEAAGCDAFLPMPCLPAELARTIQRFVEAREAAGCKRTGVASSDDGNGTSPVRPR